MSGFFIALFFVGWSVLNFHKVKGTPVPFNPPPALVTTGPYAYVRNPMLSGIFLLLFGLGILFGSIRDFEKPLEFASEKSGGRVDPGQHYAEPFYEFTSGLLGHPWHPHQLCRLCGGSAQRTLVAGRHIQPDSEPFKGLCEPRVQVAC